MWYELSHTVHAWCTSVYTIRLYFACMFSCCVGYGRHLTLRGIAVISMQYTDMHKYISYIMKYGCHAWVNLNARASNNALGRMPNLKATLVPTGYCTVLHRAEVAYILIFCLHICPMQKKQFRNLCVANHGSKWQCCVALHAQATSLHGVGRRKQHDMMWT